MADPILITWTLAALLHFAPPEQHSDAAGIDAQPDYEVPQR